LEQTPVNDMEHAKKFVLTDPRFVRPSIRNKALSGLDTDISNILESDASDEIKAKSYAAALSRLKNISNPKVSKSKPVEKQPPSSDLNYKKLFKMLKQKKQTKNVKHSIIEPSVDETDAESDKDDDWENINESRRNTSTPRPASDTSQNILRQSIKRNAGDKAHHYWADLSESFERASKPRKSTRLQSKRKAWVQY
jgi:hypothetical protein